MPGKYSSFNREESPILYWIQAALWAGMAMFLLYAGVEAARLGA